MQIILDPGAGIKIINANTFEIISPRRAPIAVLNQSTVLNDSEIIPAIPDFQKAVDEDFEPAWNQGANMYWVPRGKSPIAGHWWIAILDDSDQAGALAYHDLTPEGLPLAKVFAKTEQAAGASWTVALTHELFEMLADPWLTISGQNANTGVFYAWETADAVEADNIGYTKGKTLISDFVLPSWFEVLQANTKWDFQGKLTAPFSLETGGYLQTWNCQTSQWDLVQADRSGKLIPVVAPSGSRRERRTKPKANWKRSAATFT